MAARLCYALGVAMLAGCGYNVPFGEKLLPESYGPPFGGALKDNQPHHPHQPGASERLAVAEPSRTYDSFDQCQAALETAVAAHAGQVTRTSPVESIGLYEADGVVHEQSCAGPVLSHRSWCRATDAHGGAGEAHKRVGAKAPDEACHGEATSH